MTKYVHGRVRLATSTPRVREYDYGTKTYEPVDYYGDHFMYRDDPNLLPVRQGLYASYSPTPSQNALTAYPPQTLYSPHSSSYSQNWNPLSGVCKPCSMGYLGSSDMDDLAMLNDIESGEVGLIEEEGGGFVQGILKWWNDLSPEDKETIKSTGKQVVDEAVSGGKRSGTGRGKPNQQFQSRLDQMTLGQLSYMYKMFDRMRPKQIFAGILRQIRAEVVSRLYRDNKPLFTTIIPLQPSSTSSQDDKKGGAGALILGAGALALLASLF